MATRVTEFSAGYITLTNSPERRHFYRAVAHPANDYAHPAHLSVTWTDGSTSLVFWPAVVEIAECVYATPGTLKTESATGLEDKVQG